MTYAYNSSMSAGSLTPIWPISIRVPLIMSAAICVLRVTARCGNFSAIACSASTSVLSAWALPPTNPLDHSKTLKAWQSSSQQQWQQNIAGTVLLNIKQNNSSLKLWSTHSIRVTAANLLHRANLLDSYIQTRLRWKISSFLMYLRNTIYGADAHTRASNVNLGAKEQPRASYQTVPEEHRPILISMRAQ